MDDIQTKQPRARPGGALGRLLNRARRVFRGQSGSLMADNMMATIVASIAIIGLASGSIMFSTATVSHQQGAFQRQAASNAVSSAVAQHPATKLTASGTTRTQDGVKVKLWSSTVGGQTIYNGQAVNCVGPGCRVYSSPLQPDGPVAVGTIKAKLAVSRSDSVLEFTLPSGHDQFFYAMEGVDGDHMLSWFGKEQGTNPSYYEMTSMQCVTAGCTPTSGEAVFGGVTLPAKTTKNVDFTIHLRDPDTGPYTLKPTDNIIVYTLPEA